MSARVMNIWIVEDDKYDAMKAFEAIGRVGFGESCTVFWDSTLCWSSDMDKLPSRKDRILSCKLDHMPDIVILDLLDADARFAAGKFYEELRSEERRSDLPTSFVIMWSVQTGLPDVHRFLGTKLKVDRRLIFTNTKTVPVLEEHLARCLKSWREAQFL